MLNVKEAWSVDQRTFGDLKEKFYVAIRTLDGKTYRSKGFTSLDEADMLMFTVMDAGRASERNFEEADQYGVDVLEPLT